MKWHDELETSTDFVLMLTPAYIQSDGAMLRFKYAKALKKPMLVFILKGTEIPEGLFEGCIVVHKEMCETFPDMVQRSVVAMNNRYDSEGANVFLDDGESVYDASAPKQGS